ncbi:hypothetical protein [Deinococcus sp.]|uniref:hypothetical protein n=1 Tax=Deinococcus sp. TaxID=47478 RepID=UPI00391C9D62
MSQQETELKTVETCATCRFITYQRKADEGPQHLFCENSELSQGVFGQPPLFFRPPKLAFSCNRWALRGPDVGFVPTHIRDEPAPAAPKIPS